MKLIPLIILTLSLAVDNKAHEHFTFPPQFHAGIFTTEKNPYLPPEAHTPLPYFQMSNMNKLPFQYLPPIAAKAPSGYPTPFPMMMSSTLRPIKIEDDDDEEDDKPKAHVSQHSLNKFNRTQRMPNQMAERREMRQFPKNLHNPIDRIDTKTSFQLNTSPDPPSQSVNIQTMTPRSISIMDLQRDTNIEQMKAREHSMDQIKAASYLGAQYVQQPSIYISSTTETAIPILRLSNEMDLDGSFSYEALGADQTHYVQHSRMENAGTGKDEQVVEGSYSYVGDNGKTYTVHYIADANGFRASGDHLPVAPPVPEIIQRAIQYNLAEESKKPPHLKSWNEEPLENELSESEKRHRFAIAPPRLGSLFTGKTPESFSHSFSQPSNTQNNLVAAASSQSAVQTAIEFSDQIPTKQNSGTISPQITFLASQGAHVPSVNAPQQQSVNRIFSTEKSTMPQLVNYEAILKEPDQESNKALWRWQYGINANANQNIDKKLISRSFGTDDIIINFDDMNSEQYTKMMKEQLESNTKENIEPPQQFESAYTKEIDYYGDYKSNSEIDDQSANNNLKEIHVQSNPNQYSTESVTVTDSTEANQGLLKDSPPVLKKKYHQPEPVNDISQQLESEGSQTSRPKLITQQQFIPQSQTVTQTYNYDTDNFESRKTKILNSDPPDITENMKVLPLLYEKYRQYDTEPKKKEFVSESTITSTPEAPIINSKLAEFSNALRNSNIRFTDFIVPENKDDFKPLFKVIEPRPEPPPTTTDSSIEYALEENIFLKNLFRHNEQEYNNIKEENNNNIILKVKPLETRVKSTDNKSKHNDNRIEKHSKFVEYQTKEDNDNKFTRKPLDIANLLNYITRNQFESSKVKSSPKQAPSNLQQKKYLQNDAPNLAEEMMGENKYRNHRILQRQDDELQGVIKNYKVLHRNNNFRSMEQEDLDRIRRHFSPPTLKPINLPPLGRAGPSMKSYLPPTYV